MKKLRGHWSNLLIWTLVHLARCTPYYACKDANPIHVLPRDTGQYCEETLNSLNFSLGPRAGIEDDSTLNGTIKRLSGWNEYNRTLGTLDRCPYTNCEPSQLRSLKLVQHSRKINPGIHESSFDWPAIQIEFTVPKPSFPNNYVVEAIKLTLSSDKNAINGDPSFQQKHRLFDFANYSYSSPDSDDTRPELKRLLQFPCFMGFYHKKCPTEDYKVYSLTLTSFSKRTDAMLKPYTELAYNITVYGYHAYHPDPTVWKSTIAIALFPGNKDVTVVFDQAPDSRSVSMHNVSLIDAHTNATYKYELIPKDKNKWCFENTKDGVYYILIRPLCNDAYCTKSGNYTKSHQFTVGEPKPFHIEGAVFQSQTMSSSLHVFLSVGSGVCIALTLLGLLCYYRWKNHSSYAKTELHESFPTVLLLYSNINEMNCDLAESFVRTCNRNQRMDIIYDRSANESERIEHQGYVSWYTEKLESSSAVIILWTTGSDVKPVKSDVTYNEFNMAVTKALNSKTHDDKKLCCIYLEKSHKKTIPKDIQKETRIFPFPEKSSQMFSFLYGHKSLKSTSVYIDNSFKERLVALQRNNFIPECTIKDVEDGVGDRNNQQEDVTDQDIEELKKRVFQSELSHSGSSSTSNGENVLFNPKCPIHGKVFDEKKKPLRTNPDRPYSLGIQQTYRSSGPGAPVHIDSCQHRHMSSYRDRNPNADEYPSYYDENDCIHPHVERVYCPPINNRNVPCSAYDWNREGRIEIPRDIFSNSYPPRGSTRQSSDGDDVGYEDYLRSSERSFSKAASGHERREKTLPSNNYSCEDDTEETPLTSSVPTFYLEEDDHYTSEKIFQRMNSMDSIESKNSNYSDYSKRSDSISSFELKQSFQKFI